MRHIVGRLRNRTAAFTHDLLMIPCAWFGAYWLRFNLEAIPLTILEQSVRMLPLVMLVQGVVFWYLGLYRGVWRFASLPDLLRILNAAVVGVALSAVGIFFLTRMVDVPRSVIPLFALLLVAFLGGPRLLYRWARERGARAVANTRVLIVGAGQAGEILLRELLRDTTQGWEPVAFVDDASTTRGREIHGVRVIAKCARIPEVVAAQKIDLVLLAIPSANSREMRRLVGLCEQARVPFRTLPGTGRIPHSEVGITQLRPVSIEDLLGREAVKLDWSAIRAGTTGRVVLVSGGGGSIGSELVRQIARLEPACVAVLDNGEFNLYSIDHELRQLFPQLKVRRVLADVRDEAAVTRAFAEIRPSVVFHAAAYKHVPMLEDQIREAVRNNVLGTRNVAMAAVGVEVESFVLISTDKAVNPTNVMGATKRVAELLCQNLNAESPLTKFVTVRFGNVLDSAGSVVPLFRRQIAEGGPVTVTHPDVKRYFMTIPEACELILQAAALGRGGEIFVLDMGEPILIQYLAEQMIFLSGRRLNEEIEIVHTGLRPGEKLFEELFHDEERLSATPSEKILLARSRTVAWSTLSQALSELDLACMEFDEASLKRLLRELVPEYVSAPVFQTSNVVSFERLSTHPTGSE
jgi:FlaA1/EpsC-like NDP-sugar epimerase